MIIVLSGKKCVGKDTVADEMKHQIFTHYQKMGVPTNQIPMLVKMPLAMPIKRIVRDLTCIPIQTLDKNKEMCMKHFTGFISDKSPRDFYKEVGDKMCDTFGKECFVKYTVGEIFKQQEEDPANHFIISDMRFDFEFNYLKNIPNIVFIRIKRDKFNDDKHYSETSLDNVPDSEFDYVIDNNQNLLFLKKKVEDILLKLNLITNE